MINDKDKRKLYKKWQAIYDVKYVDKLLMTPLDKNKTELIAIRDKLKSKSSNVGKFVKKPPTEPKAFKLKDKKSIILPEPEVLKILAPPNPIPKTTYDQPEYLDALLMRDREHERQSRVAALLKDADGNAFDCAATDKSDKTIQRMQQIRQDESRKLDFNRKHQTSLPSKKSKSSANQNDHSSIIARGKTLLEA